MSLSLDKFRAKLVIKILYARSGAETERFVRAAVMAMEKKKVNGYIITRFIDRIMNQLNNFHPFKTNETQWNNITVARSCLANMKEFIQLPARSA